MLSRHADVAAAPSDPPLVDGRRPGDRACGRHRGAVPQAMREVVEHTSYVLAHRIARREQADLVEESVAGCPREPSACAGAG
ncbi:hypothetical protein [Streptomyces sp. NPDC096193]|uniref:hypothetical protein n=1 Tax=Streptomyces sp. NPDC096193 TaxID=3155821 RepID=UPI0033238947